MKKFDLLNLAKQLQIEEDIVSDLWTWLPSFREAQKYHGDHYHNYKPKLDNIVLEACLIFSVLNGHGLNSEEYSIFNCPCTENHPRDSLDRESTIEKILVGVSKEFLEKALYHLDLLKQSS